MAGTHRRKGRRVLTVSAWLGAGVTTAGVGAALLGGTAVANAGPTNDSSSTHASDASSTHTSSPARQTTKSPAKHIRDSGHSPTSDSATPASENPARHVAAKAPTAGDAYDATQADEQSTPKTTRTTAAALATDSPTAVSKTALTDSSTAPVLSRNTKGDKGTPSSPRLISRAIGQAVSGAVDEVSNDLASTAASVATAAASLPTTAASTTTSETGQTTANATTKTTSAAASSALATPETTNWLGSSVAQPGTFTALALQQISTAKTQLNTDTWGQGNVFAGLATLGAQTDLAVAQWALTTWQTNNPSQMQAVADNVNNPLGQAFARMVLSGTQQLPGFAVFMLQSAASTTPALAWFGVSSAEATSTTNLISAAATNARVYGVVPLIMYAGTEPIVYVRVNGGPLVPVLVDTGSSGLVIGSNNVGQSGLGAATGAGAGAYAGGLNYTYTTYNTTVDFGNGIVTEPTAVNIVDASSETAFENYISGDGVVGVLGIGANAFGPGPSIVTAALPGELADGVLIDEAGGRLVFGPNSLPARTTVSGSPYALGTVVVNGSSHPIWLIIDSGGVTGTLPSAVLSGATTIKNGTPISVYAPDGTLLYSYFTSGSNSPYVTTDDGSADAMNTGYAPFSLYPIYIGYDTPEGTTVFDY
ncbi:PecA family PE domain-processing aspartic protease [Mycobacterium sp. OTB74]|uniref:PecA family PE domain-processing aspartic protease n=1 Tax=Mycobacterium sp. OTB74 TaxID=1853452 RepID=UPI0024765580|nr:PecA family PE domain-processing aspartic protease [Mycobacterium sp. OTB74]MDH6244326.1 hypothetical protein [Mycobacterium sp. OTB74]